jgi:hypothetical protein
MDAACAGEAKITIPFYVLRMQLKITKNAEGFFNRLAGL